MPCPLSDISVMAADDFSEKIFASTEKSGIFAPPLKNKANEGELVAQLVEHIPFKDGVLGSSPNWLTKAIKVSWSLFCYFSDMHPYLLVLFSVSTCNSSYFVSFYRFLFLNLSPKYGF